MIELLRYLMSLLMTVGQKVDVVALDEMVEQIPEDTQDWSWFIMVLVLLVICLAVVFLGKRQK
jgi:hypothetical protein